MIAFQQIFNKCNTQPKKLWTDEGTEFYNRTFQNFLKDNDITLYRTFNEVKAEVIECFNRTFKGRLYKKFTELSSQQWVSLRGSEGVYGRIYGGGRCPPK